MNINTVNGNQRIGAAINFGARAGLLTDAMVDDASGFTTLQTAILARPLPAGAPEMLRQDLLNAIKRGVANGAFGGEAPGEDFSTIAQMVSPTGVPANFPPTPWGVGDGNQAMPADPIGED